ncbi:MAG: flagellar basal body P-ring formation chaperone FlgA [Ignavibacteriales bacterium]|nr:flagellar basal body P-ring formation chaperone FlgA [Ignavibacteriales bacterium]
MFGLISILIGLVFGQGQNFNVQLKKYLDEKLNSYAKYEYQIIQAPKNYSRIEISEDRKSRLNKNYFYLPVKIYDNKNIASLSLLTIRVKLYKNVFSAAKEIRRNENLLPNMFELKLADVSLYGDNIINVTENLANYRSKVLVKSGSILSGEMIEPIPVINRGDKIFLHTGGLGVDVSIDVTARQDGCAGDVISVLSNGNKLYKGKIVDKSNLTLVE